MLHSAYEKTWMQLDAMDRDTTWFVLPISAMEQHGPHLPVGTDDMVLQAIVKDFEKQYKPSDEVVMLPTLSYGNSVEHYNFPGTISLSCKTLISFVSDVIHSLTRNGFKRVILLNSHGGNSRLLHAHAQQWRVEYDVRIYNVDFWESTFFNEMETAVQGDYNKEVHAGEIETSIVYYAHKDMQVLQDKIEDIAVELKPYFYGWASSDLSKNGTLGYASLWSEETGEKFVNFASNKLCEVFDDILQREKK